MSDRPTIRCAACRLNQFMTANGYCRKCGAPLVRTVSGACEKEPIDLPSALQDSLSVLVAARVRIVRHARHLSQRNLAELIDVPRTYISKIERGSNTPTIPTLDRLCRALKCPPYFMLSEPAQFAAFLEFTNKNGHIELHMAEVHFPHGDGLAV